jgi:hypothetical protein
LQQLGSGLGLLGGVLLAIYAFPGSPLRKLLDSWIERRVARRFDIEMAVFRHRLEVDAEMVRAEHQRRLYDASLYSAKKHEVYRELFRLFLVAEGHVAQLSGGHTEPAYEQYSRADIDSLMARQGLQDPVRNQVLSRWASDREAAVDSLLQEIQRATLLESETAATEAWDYSLVNALYLADEVEAIVAGLRLHLRENLRHAFSKRPNSGTEQARLKSDTSAAMKRLKHTLRSDLDPETALRGHLPSA